MNTIPPIKQQESEAKVMDENGNECKPHSDENGNECKTQSDESDKRQIKNTVKPQPRENSRNPHNKHQRKPAYWKKLTRRIDPLSVQMLEFQRSAQQSLMSLREKLYLRDLLYNMLLPHFPECGLYIVGSTLNGFGNGSSDMDLCLMISRDQLDQRVEAVKLLHAVVKHLKVLKIVGELEIISAKVPILRATFKEPFENVIVDLNANNTVAIRNTHLLFHYSGYDWRVRPLVHAVKAWAKKCGINNANKASLTSYSLVLMAINYLQCGIGKPILPALQSTYKSEFSTDIDVCELDIARPLDKERLPKNNVSPGDLLKGFFRYYTSEFDFDKSAVSVRVGKVLKRSEVASHHTGYELAQWRCICIEEPFALSNAAHSVYDERTFDYIKESFKKAHSILDEGGSLEDLLNGDYEDSYKKSSSFLSGSP